MPEAVIAAFDKLIHRSKQILDLLVNLSCQSEMQPELKVNVLLVDDHPEFAGSGAILSSLGQNLVKAHSGAEALRRLLNQVFVILLDVQMPGMDGFETATLIRNRERSRLTPIIFLTAFTVTIWCSEAIPWARWTTCSSRLRNIDIEGGGVC